MKIFPNPVARTDVMIEFAYPDGTRHVEISDVLGNRMFSHGAPVGQNPLVVPTVNWKPGVYFVRISDRNTTHVEKIIVH